MGHFNTSNVNVYLIDQIHYIIRYNDFNTSNVNVYRVPLVCNGFVVRISIHLMLMFI